MNLPILSKIIQYLSSCVWLLLLSMTEFHPCCGRDQHFTPPYGETMFRYTDISCVVNLFTWCRQSGHSHLSAVVSKAAVSVAAVSVTSGMKLGAEWLGHVVMVFRSLRGRIPGCCHGGPGTWANRVTGTWLRPGGSRSASALRVSLLWKCLCGKGSVETAPHF